MVKRNLLKRWAARAGALFSVLLIMCCMIFPVSAASGSESVWYSVLPLDGVRLYESTTSYVDLPWLPDAWNTNGSTSEVMRDSSGYAVTYSYLSLAEESVNFEAAFTNTLGAFSHIVLYADEAIIKTSDLRDANFSFGFGFNGDQGAGVCITFFANRVTSSGEYYYPQSKQFSQIFHCPAGTDILDLIAGMITDGNYFPAEEVYLSDLTIEFFELESEDQWVSFDVDLRQSRPSYHDWLRQYTLPCESKIVYEVVEGGFSFDWLISAVSGVLSIELWPGFSLSGLLGVVLTICLVFAFFKIFVG